LEKLCEIQDLVLLKGWEAFVDGPWPLDEPSDDTHPLLLERGFWGHDLHLHGSLFLFLLLKLTVDLILEVFSLASADRAVILLPLVVVNLSGRKSGNSRYSESI
jgi:hypothetical protein